MLDVGGNIGWYSTLLAGAGCRVETFEPLPYNYNNLLKAVQLNPWLRERVHLNRVGVGTSTAETVINFVKGETGGSFITNPSLEHTNMYAANDQFSSGITKVPIHIERIDTLVEQNGAPACRARPAQRRRACTFLCPVQHTYTGKT